MIKPRFELCGRAGSSLFLSPLGQGDLLAELEAAGVRAQVEIRNGVEFELATFLEVLQAPGWPDKRWLESPEGELYLAAANEGGGDVRLFLELRNRDETEPWLLEASLRVRQSDLGQLALRARDFSHALRRSFHLKGNGSAN